MLRALMRIGTAIHASLVKATGRFGGGTEDGKVLVLTHQGAKSGKVRSTPLMFVNVGEAHAIAASAGGSDRNPAWLHNLRAHPDVTISVGGEDIPVRARVTEGAERDQLYDRFKAVADGFARYEERTDRVIPVVVLDRR